MKWQTQLIRYSVTLALASAAGCATQKPEPGERSQETRPSTGPSTEGKAEPAVTWDHRMLVVFAEDERDERLDEQRKLLGPGAPQLRARDVRMIEVVGPDPLRDALNVPDRGFHVVLVGYDNVVRLRTTDVVTLSNVTYLMAPTTKPSLGQGTAKSNGTTR